MPSEEHLTHTHRYSSYLLDLAKHWAYERRAPGRDRNERRQVREWNGAAPHITTCGTPTDSPTCGSGNASC